VGACSANMFEHSLTRPCLRDLFRRFQFQVNMKMKHERRRNFGLLRILRQTAAGVCRGPFRGAGPLAQCATLRKDEPTFPFPELSTSAISTIVRWLIHLHVKGTLTIPRTGTTIEIRL